MITLNGRTVTLKMTRREVCDLLLICNGMEGAKWSKIHDKIREQLDKFDAKMEENEDDH